MRLQHAVDELRPPVIVISDEADGAWTPGPHVSIECGNAIELSVEEFRWLIEEGGPAILAELP